PKGDVDATIVVPIRVCSFIAGAFPGARRFRKVARQARVPGIRGRAQGGRSEGLQNSFTKRDKGCAETAERRRRPQPARLLLPQAGGHRESLRALSNRAQARPRASRRSRVSGRALSRNRSPGGGGKGASGAQEELPVVRQMRGVR